MKWTNANLLRVVAASASCLAVLVGVASAQAPAVSMHQLEWHIHEDLVTAQRPLQGFWEPLVAQASRDAEILLRGDQGPADSACCVGYEVTSVSSFSGASLLSIDNGTEFGQLDVIGTANTARVFVVQSLTWCNGPGDPIGCADFPFCGMEPADRKAVISLEAYEEFDSLGQVLAHEVGHTTCLDHVTNETCELMAASSGGGCVSASECNEYTEDAQTTTGTGTCECYADATTFAADGTSCSLEPGGLCSGGVCGAPGGDASADLFAALDPSSANGGTPNRAARMSALAGGWSELGTFDAEQHAPQGLAYSPGRDVLYGVAPDGGDAEVLLSVDPSTGQATEIGTISGLQTGTTVVGLAWDPGATPAESDDRLLAMDLEPGTNFSRLYALDPDTAVAVPLSPSGINIFGPGGFSGLAYDPVNQMLYATAAFTNGQPNPTGIYRIQTVCIGSFCNATEVVDAGLLGQTNKFDSAFGYDAQTHRFFHAGRQSGDRIEYDSYDADALASDQIQKIVTRGIDAATFGGLAAVPEPSGLGGALAALASLFAVRRIRS